jgi:opacity protein-like surface antigen
VRLARDAPTFRNVRCAFATISEEKANETSPPKTSSASRSRRRRAAGRITDRECGYLPVSPGAHRGGSVSKTTAGWTGAGTEYDLDNHWSVKAEYLYFNPGSVSFSSTGATSPSCGYTAGNLYNATHSAHLEANIVRGGISYKFW